VGETRNSLIYSRARVRMRWVSTNFHIFLRILLINFRKSSAVFVYASAVTTKS
jgi:hypothetical protein